MIQLVADSRPLIQRQALFRNCRLKAAVLALSQSPHANNLTIGIMALVAQKEAEAISKRTKEALKAAKARSTVLGNPNGAEALRKAAKGNTAAVSVVKSRADSHAQNLKPVIASLNADGFVSLGAIATALNQRSILTPRGGTWHKTSVKNLLARLAA